MGKETKDIGTPRPFITVAGSYNRIYYVTKGQTTAIARLGDYDITDTLISQYDLWIASIEEDNKILDLENRFIQTGEITMRINFDEMFVVNQTNKNSTFNQTGFDNEEIRLNKYITEQFIKENRTNMSHFNRSFFEMQVTEAHGNLRPSNATECEAYIKDNELHNKVGSVPDRLNAIAVANRDQYKVELPYGSHSVNGKAYIDLLEVRANSLHDDFAEYYLGYLNVVTTREPLWLHTDWATLTYAQKMQYAVTGSVSTKKTKLLDETISDLMIKNKLFPMGNAIAYQLATKYANVK